MKVVLACMLAACISACEEETEPARDASAGDDAASADADASMRDGSSEDPLRAAVGTFGIQLVAAVPESEGAAAASAYTDIVGRVHDALVPSGMQWRRIAEDGDCELFEPHNPFCDPSCTSGATCIDGNTCVPPATALDVGTVVLRGLHDAAGPTEITMMPREPSNLYQPRGSSTLAYPPFEADDTITLSAAGGELAPFELSARAIAPLELLTEAPVPFGGETPTVLRWTANEGSSTRIIVRVDISHHGGAKGEVVCDTEDDGELELPASIVEGLIELGVAGYPSLEVERVSTNDPLAAAPGIVLRIFSSVTRALEIPGVVSCNEENEAEVCEEGQTCLVTALCGEEG